MRNIDRSTLISTFVDAVATTLGKHISAQEKTELDRIMGNLLEDLRAESTPRPQMVTVLLADLRGFSAISESYPPTTVIDMLNRYFAGMGKLIHEYGGTIDKFMGDSVMALFGAPHHHDDDLQRALACAVRMQQVMIDINRESTTRDQPAIYAGIGINTGEVMAGTFGSALHYEYTVIGDDVNLAARIEAYSLRGQILLSEQSYRLARDSIEIGSVNQVRVKGKERPVNLYELLAVTQPQRLVVPGVEIRKSPRVKVDMPLLFYRVKNKQLESNAQRGKILDLGYNGMLAHLPEQLSAFTEIAFTLTPHPTSDETSTLYAKVINSHGSKQGFLTCLEFTLVGTPGHQAVKRYVDQALWGR